MALVCPLASASAPGVTEHATLDASFASGRICTPIMITFGFRLATSDGAAPPPLTSLDLKMPAGLN